jgi:serine/threonine protein kinase
VHAHDLTRFGCVLQTSRGQPPRSADTLARVQVPQENEQLASLDVPDEAPLTRTLGKYQLVARLGQGGMATVYLALAAGPAGFSKLMVLKVLREEPPADFGSGELPRSAMFTELRQLFANEARLSARFLHRNIVHTYEVDEIDGCCVLSMEYLDGQTYRRTQARAARAGGLPLAEQLRILSETAHGLHYVHTLSDFDGSELGVVHCDVSPQNVFISYDGHVKLLDFGISQTHASFQQTPPQPPLASFKGKLDYVAPEQLRGEPVDARTDVFSLGVMLWEAISGARFGGGRGVDSVVKVQARLAGAEPSIRDVVPEVDDALAQIVERALAPEPSARFADAAAFAGALEDYLEQVGARPSARSLSRLVTPLFAHERAELRAVVDRHMQRDKASRAPGELPALDLTRSGVLALGGPWAAGREQTSTFVSTLAAAGEGPTASTVLMAAPSVPVATIAPPHLEAGSGLAPRTPQRGGRLGGLKPASVLALGGLVGVLLGLLDVEQVLPAGPTHTAPAVEALVREPELALSAGSAHAEAQQASPGAEHEPELAHEASPLPLDAQPGPLSLLPPEPQPTLPVVAARLDLPSRPQGRMRTMPLLARTPEGALLSARAPEGALLSARTPEGALRHRRVLEARPRRKTAARVTPPPAHAAAPEAPVEPAAMPVEQPVAAQAVPSSTMASQQERNPYLRR